MPRSSRFAYALLGVIWVTTSIFAPQAAARVGVTSATNGDPTGKPPQDAERILRVGIDVVADELITTRDDDRAHLIFLDGTSLTVSPNAQLKIDRFVYDPNTRTGDISITATKGVFRLVGGKISKASAITVNTPSASMGLRGGISIFSVDQRQTTAQFLFGKSLVMTAGGKTETAYRAGTEIHSVFGGTPGLPSAIAHNALSSSLRLLEASNRGAGDASADAAAKKSGFSDQNSGRTPGAGDAGRIAALTDTTNILAQAKPPSAALIPTAAPPPPPPPPPVIPPAPSAGPEPRHHHHHHHHDYYGHRSRR